MKKIICLLVIAAYPAFANAGAFTADPPNALPAGMGGAHTAVRGEVTSIDYNPAGLAGIDDLKLLFTYRDFHSLNLIGHSYAGAALPVGVHTSMGVSYNRIGTTGRVDFTDYSEEMISLGLGSYTGILPGLRAGGLFSFYRVVAAENATGFGFSAGLMWAPENVQGLDLGLYVRNLNNARIAWTSGAVDRLSPGIAGGASYVHESGVSGAVSFDRTFRAGAQYLLPGDIFSVRAGFRALPDFRGAPSAGLSASYGRFRLDYAAESHPELGLSHFFTVNVSVERIEDEIF